jgi:hypothetical protein
MKFSTFILAPLFAASYVSAHGILKRISIQGKNFEGNGAGGPNSPSVIRQVSSQDPNKGADNPALTCGPNSGPAALVADASPGDTINFDWTTASGGKWPHNTGPMLTYMASCGPVTCDKFNQADAQWFKIDQVGRKPNNGEWVQQDLMNGGVASVKIPQNIAPGNYLIRHEIIALHLATSLGGAEFYPGCAQLKIGGNGNGVPKASELVRIPGAYRDDNPGIFDPSVFDANAPYQFPGPSVANLVAGSGSGSPSPSDTSLPASPTESTVTPQASPKPKTCNKKKNFPASGSPSPTPSTDYRPRRLGHVMRRMALENSFH